VSSTPPQSQSSTIWCNLPWSERGGPPVRQPQRHGFGSTLLTKVLPMQCDVTVSLAYRTEGVRCRIAAPLIERRLVPEY
jgi:two-component sensor histidine kinase